MRAEIEQLNSLLAGARDLCDVQRERLNEHYALLRDKDTELAERRAESRNYAQSIIDQQRKYEKTRDERDEALRALVKATLR